MLIESIWPCIQKMLGENRNRFPLPSTIVIFLRLAPHLISFDCFCLAKDFIYYNGSFLVFCFQSWLEPNKIVKTSIFHQFYCYYIKYSDLTGTLRATFCRHTTLV